MSYRATVRHGPENSLKDEAFIESGFAIDAARTLAAKVAPGSSVFPGRTEHPANGVSTWSFGWTGSGQRIWVCKA